MPLREHSDKAIPIWFTCADTWPGIRSDLAPQAAAFAAASGFEPTPGRVQLLPDLSGNLGAVLFGIERANARTRDLLLPGRLATSLPAGLYRFANGPHDPTLASLSWLLSGYKFSRYKANDTELPELCVPEGVDAARVERIAQGVMLGRDLINTPANDLGTDALEQAALKLATQYRAKASVTRGEKLLQPNFPLIHAVGRASDKATRLIDFSWGAIDAPKVTLVGKGVCFDSGGLDIKPESAMLLMKKDMGGAATVLALAHMIMGRQLPVRLRVLIPAVENSISGSAFRPLDIYRARNGLAVEIGNTDAEGRLILADALSLADEERPDLLVDMGTLTGAARVALGPDLPAFYANDETLAAELVRTGAQENDPFWRMPLWPPYLAMLDSKVADTNNVSNGTFAGSITCALFLSRFVSAAKAWLHFDIYAWTAVAKPGRPEGGECQV